MFNNAKGKTEIVQTGLIIKLTLKHYNFKFHYFTYSPNNVNIHFELTEVENKNKQVLNFFPNLYLNVK